ncbi:hypothetical protein [Nitrosomonas sp. Nm33]|uniref:hypothetical protein n=2 Tax=Nitrosomonas sp. Nm33 TaxID=133724 RepID=UPI00115F82B3
MSKSRSAPDRQTIFYFHGFPMVGRCPGRIQHLKLPTIHLATRQPPTQQNQRLTKHSARFDENQFVDSHEPPAHNPCYPIQRASNLNLQLVNITIVMDDPVDILTINAVLALIFCIDSKWIIFMLNVPDNTAIALDQKRTSDNTHSRQLLL